MRRSRSETLALIFAFSGRVSGAVTTLAIVRLVGAGVQANALFLAVAVYTLVTSIQISLLETNTIALHGGGTEPAAGRLVYSGILFGALTSSAAMGICLVAARVLPPVAQALPLIAVLLVSGPLVGLFAVLLGVSVCGRQWSRPAVGSWLRVAVIVAGSVFLVPRLGLVGVPVAVVVADCIRLTPFLGRMVRGRRAVAGPSGALLRSAFVQLPSSIAGSANPLIDRIVVAQLALGSLAVLDLAEKSYGLAALIFTQGVLPPLFQRWASATKGMDSAPEMRRLAVRALPVGAVLAAVCSAATIWAAPLAAGPTLSAQGGVFRAATVAYMLGLPAYLSAQVLVRLLVLQGRGRLLNLTAAVQLAVNVVADLVLGSLWGLAGVALATSVVTWAGWALIWRLCRSSPRVPSLPSTMARAG